ncbi:unnamed protein product [Phaedon cochleariae]|uniref:Uncharacterized protein n=1 Tax=Phaedon cochleariae TaxID=80249 RepID=A0A9N9SD72_PHACE|nr:unnamed protein product [Phaedon cochleariae]
MIRGFFRGATASLPRAFIGTSQLTSFAVAKEGLNKFEVFQQNPIISTALAGAAAGVVLSVATTPFDMVLTNIVQWVPGLHEKNLHEKWSPTVLQGNGATLPQTRTSYDALSPLLGGIQGAVQELQPGF